MLPADRLCEAALGFNLDAGNGWRGTVQLAPASIVQVQTAQVQIQLHDDPGRWRGLWRRRRMYWQAEQARLRLEVGGFPFYELPLFGAWRDVSLLTRGLLSWSLPINGTPIRSFDRPELPAPFTVSVCGILPRPCPAVRVCVVLHLRTPARAAAGGE